MGFFRWVTTSIGVSWVFFSRFFHSSPMVSRANMPETSAFAFFVRFTRASWVSPVLIMSSTISTLSRFFMASLGMYSVGAMPESRPSMYVSSRKPLTPIFLSGLAMIRFTPRAFATMVPKGMPSVAVVRTLVTRFPAKLARAWFAACCRML